MCIRDRFSFCVLDVCWPTLFVCFLVVSINATDGWKDVPNGTLNIKPCTFTLTPASIAFLWYCELSKRVCCQSKPARMHFKRRERGAMAHPDVLLRQSDGTRHDPFEWRYLISTPMSRVV